MQVSMYRTPRGLLAALALFAATAAAQDFPSTPKEYLRRVDANGDGKVDEAEYVRYMSQGFQRMDINGDGVIDANDGPMRPGARPIHLDEFQRNLIHQFHKLDTNKDGYLNARELTQPPQ
jgi:Ca2+-binding EF-hand superfamily protein